MTTTQITTAKNRNEVTSPSSIDPKLDRAMSVAFNGLREEFGDLTIYADRVPGPEHRRGLEDRAVVLRDALSPGRQTDIRKELAKLFTMPHQNAEMLDGKLLVETYLEDIGDLPLWAIQKACQAFRRGEASTSRFAPPAGELRRYAKALMRRYEDELRKIEKVLNARVVDALRFA